MFLEDETYHMYCVHSNDFMLAKHYFGKKPKLIGVFCTFIRGQVNYNAATEPVNCSIKEHGKSIHKGKGL